jgi:hypothetical protein
MPQLDEKRRKTANQSQWIIRYLQHFLLNTNKTWKDHMIDGDEVGRGFNI